MHQAVTLGFPEFRSMRASHPEALKEPSGAVTRLPFEDVLANRLSDFGGSDIETVKANEWTPPAQGAEKDNRPPAFEAADGASPADSVGPSRRKAIEGESREERSAGEVPNKKADTEISANFAARTHETAARGKKTEERDRAAKALESLLPVMQNLLALLARAGARADLLRETRELHNEMRGLGGGADKKARSERIEQLLARLRELSKKIERFGQNAGKDGTDQPSVHKARQEAGRIADLIAGEIGKHGKRRGGTEQRESESTEFKIKNQERLPAFIAGVKDEARESAAPKNNNTAGDFHSQFLKNTGRAERGHEPAASRQKPLLFDEQLQSILHNARIVVRDAKNGSFSVRLHPESLGRVTVNLGLDGGILTGRFLVETQEVRQALLEQLSQVQEQLEDAGITVGEFQVNVRDDGRYSLAGSDRDAPALRGFRPAAAAAVVNPYEADHVSLHDGAIDLII